MAPSHGLKTAKCDDVSCWLGFPLSEPGFSGLLDFQDYEFVSPNCQSKIEVSYLQRTYDIPNPNPVNLPILQILVQTIKSAAPYRGFEPLLRDAVF